MQLASVLPVSPGRQNVANVDHVGILHRWTRDPRLSSRVQDFKAFLTRVLQKEGDGAEISMSAGYFNA